MAKTFPFHEDPGHGWLEVTLDDVAGLGLAKGSFSAFSYRRADRLFLEEDCDAPKFIAAYEAVNGKIETKRKFTNYDSFIRSLPGIHESTFEDFRASMVGSRLEELEVSGAVDGLGRVYSDADPGL